MKDWTTDKEWADLCLPRVKEIIGGALICSAQIEDDRERNTDLIVLKMDAVRIACRIRRPEYHNSYANEFTIREGRPSGFKTELTKVIEGWGDYFFYGFAGIEQGRLRAWMLGDLKVFRLWFNRQIAQHKGNLPGQRMQNNDGSSSFRAFRISELPQEFIVKRLT